MAGQNATKKRNWAFVLYPTEGNPPAPADWLEKLKQTGLQIAISPLHDKDTDPDEKEKRPHRHVIAVYGNTTTFNNVKRLTDSLNAPIPIALEQVRGYYRYLTHKDNPEKHQYDEKDIILLNGFNIADFTEMSKAEVQAIVRKIHLAIRELVITEYADLMDYLFDRELWQEYEVASGHTVFFQGYLRSCRHGRTGHKKANPETGEVLPDE